MAAIKKAASIAATPAYWSDACTHLVKRDRVLKRLIPRFGDACLESRGDAFITLARSIVGQQISVKAAQSVWNRFETLPRRMAPADVLKLKVDDMRAATPELARDRFHRIGAATRDQRHRLAIIDLAQPAGDIAHHMLEPRRHMVQRAVGEDDRELFQSVRVDMVMRQFHGFPPVAG